MPAHDQEPDPEYGSYAQAATRAKVSVETIRRRIRAGEIRAKRDGASTRILVCLDDIDKLVRDAR